MFAGKSLLENTLGKAAFLSVRTGFSIQIPAGKILADLLGRNGAGPDKSALSVEAGGRRIGVCRKKVAFFGIFRKITSGLCHP